MFVLLHEFYQWEKTVSLHLALWKYIDRKFVKDYHTVNLNSIEKNAFKDLYDYCFNAENNGFDVINFCEAYSKKNKFEERIFNNFKNIYDYLNNMFTNQ